MFAASDRPKGDELWRSDGSANGTLLVSDIDPGTKSSYPWAFLAVGSSLIFSATTG